MRLKHLALILAAAMTLGMLFGCNMNRNMTNPGTTHPNTTSPGTSYPNTTSPATSYPNTNSPGTHNPGAPSPGALNPEDTTPGAAGTIPTLSTDFSEIGALDPSPVTWGPGVRKNAAGRSEACDLLQGVYGGLDALFIEQDEKVVYLTFDQGYENGFTPAILDVLKEKDVKAVFFLTGHYINSAPELVQRMVDEGHVLGNHSYNHINYATAKPEDSFADMNKLHEAVYDKWGSSMNLFRFPEGSFSEQALGLVKSTGYTSVFWSFAYNDWNPDSQMEPEAALQRVLDGAHNGCIFLFHTVGKTNSLILGDVIDKLREQGYTFDTVKPVETPRPELPGGTSEANSAPPQAPSSSTAPSSEGNIFLRPWG